MTKCFQSLGQQNKKIQNGSSISFEISEAPNFFQDFGIRNSDGTKEDSSSLKEIEFNSVESSSVSYKTNNANVVNSFEAKQLNVYRESYNIDPSELFYISIPDQFKEIKRIILPNYSKKVMPEIGKKDLGEIYLTVPKGRFFEIKLEISENSTCTKLPDGVKLNKNILSGILYNGGVWNFVITSGSSEIKFILKVPQISRIF